MALVTPGRWLLTDTVDVCLSDDVELPRDVVVHVGAAAVSARSRRLGPGALRLQLAEPLPLHLGDRLLVRDPAQRAVVGADVADLRPAPLRRRGDAAALASTLAVPVTADELVARKGFVPVGDVERAGFGAPPTTARMTHGWWVAPTTWDKWSADVSAIVAESGDVVATLPGLTVDGGQVRSAGAEPADPPEIAALVGRLTVDPLAAPEASEIAVLDRAALSAASRGGRLLHLAGAIYVGPAAVEVAVQRLRELPSPFSVSDARQALGVSRRVTVPLLEHLDAGRRTRRLPDGTRIVLTPG